MAPGIRPFGLARRAASAVLRRAVATVERVLGRAPEPRTRPAATPRDSLPGGRLAPPPDHGAVWVDHAHAYAERWRERITALEHGDQAAHVRRVRIAVRRLRVLVACIDAQADDDATIRAVDRALRRMAKRLGALRDVDVALARLAVRAEASGSDLERAALDELAHRLRRRRALALPRAVRRLAPDAIDTALGALAELVAARLDGVAPAELAQRWWQRELPGWHAQLATDLADDDLEAIHALRIAARRLRYGIELFEDVLPAHVRAWHGPCRALQRAAGEHRDAALWDELVRTRMLRAERRARVSLQRGLEPSAMAARSARRAAFLPVQRALESARTLVHAGP